MKTIRIILSFAFLAFSLVSCQYKDDFTKNEEEFQGRVITGYFESNEDQTKTTPQIDEQNKKTLSLWEDIDRIWVSNGTSSKIVVFDDSEGEDVIKGTIDKPGKKTFSFAIPADWETIYAIYPASSAVGVSVGDDNGEITINIPQVQDGSYASANICIAKTTSTRLKFKNATAIMKIRGKAEGISGCNSVFLYTSSNIAGNFKATYDDDKVVSLKPVSNYTVKRIKVSMDATATPCYFTLAGAEMKTSDKFVALNEATGFAYAKNFTKETSVSVNSCYDLGTNFGANFEERKLILNDNATFKVSATPSPSGTTVKFSRGNLTASVNSNGNVEKWWFDVYQTDCGWSDNYYFINTFTQKPSIIDLFGWSTDGTDATSGYKPWGINTSNTINDYKGGFNNWGGALPEGWGTWRTLSKTEWSYLLSTRKVKVNNVNKYPYGEGVVNNVRGLIILPDNWDGTLMTDFVYGTSEWQNIFSESSSPKWSEMENAGCIFLPAAGWREAAVSVGNINVAAGYWSSNNNTTQKSSNMGFSGNSVKPQDQSNYYDGISVRLVKQ